MWDNFAGSRIEPDIFRQHEPWGKTAVTLIVFRAADLHAIHQSGQFYIKSQRINPVIQSLIGNKQVLFDDRLITWILEPVYLRLYLGCSLFYLFGSLFYIPGYSFTDPGIPHPFPFGI